MKVGLDPSASAEIDEAAQWYEGKQTGLGQELVAEVRAAITALSGSPGVGSLIDGLDPALDVRRIGVRRFPYQIVYLTRADEIVVLAVAHDRREPRYWESRAQP